MAPCRKLRIYRSCSSSRSSTFPSCCRGSSPWFFATTEIPHLRVDKVVDAPFMQVVQISCRGAEADSHGLDSSADHRNSPVAPQDIPVVSPRLIPMVSFTIDIPQFFIDKVIDAPVVQVERVPSAVVEDSRVRCVDRFMRHEARSQLMVGSCAQAQDQESLPPSGRGRGGGVAGSLTPR